MSLAVRKVCDAVGTAKGLCDRFDAIGWPSALITIEVFERRRARTFDWVEAIVDGFYWQLWRLRLFLKCLGQSYSRRAFPLRHIPGSVNYSDDCIAGAMDAELLRDHSSDDGRAQTVLKIQFGDAVFFGLCCVRSHGDAFGLLGRVGERKTLTGTLCRAARQECF